MSAEYRPIPVLEAKSLSEEYEKSIIVIAAWDPAHGVLHMTTYGVSKQEKIWAAEGGEKVARALGTLPELGTMFEDFRVSKAEAVLGDIWKELRNDCSNVKLDAARSAIAAFHMADIISREKQELWMRRIETCPGHKDEGGRMWCAYCGNLLG